MFNSTPALWIGVILLSVVALAMKITALVVVARTGAGFVKGDACAVAGTWILEELLGSGPEQANSGEKTELAATLLALAASDVQTLRLILSPSTVTLFLDEGPALGFSESPGTTQRSHNGTRVRAMGFVEDDRVRLVTEVTGGSSLEEHYDIQVATGRLERRTRVEVPGEGLTVESARVFRRA
jgi:hypothetical protein